MAGKDKKSTLIPFNILNYVSSLVLFSLALKKLNPKYLEKITLEILYVKTALNTIMTVFVTL